MLEEAAGNLAAKASGALAYIPRGPIYDKVMRRNCLGNFRTFLEEVATSPAMLYYLDNASSKASSFSSDVEK